jgi:hypothetical protein
MEVLVKPVEEAELLHYVEGQATPAEIQEALVTKAQCCVDHLCGCSSSQVMRAPDQSMAKPQVP